MSLQVQPSGGGSAALAYADTEPDGVPTVTDPAIAMLALILESRGAQADCAREEVNGANERLEQARRQIQDAMKRAAEADKHSGFWNKLSHVFSGDIGALCEVVAAAAAIVATGGAGVTVVLAVAAAGLAVSSDVAQRAGLDPKLCLALSAAGALAGLAMGNAADGAAVWEGIAKGAELTHVAAGAAGAGATVASSNYHADSLAAQADSTAARGRQTTALFDFDLALDVLKRSASDSSRAEQATSNIVQSENDGRTALVARLGAV
jgi:hypothetical protein